MKPTNFPTRLKRKRLKALENLKAGSKSKPNRVRTGAIRTPEQKEQEIKKLEELTR